ncbi:MAG TPA: CpsB/CapC family capsule biosynthesis tyrosine phosphatase [Solirubrobacteraceae bacterium]|nr:CpsB/CapC family capsule biosynthesis tyrosine phosphatase [Solirubrobacteraceae bacterium]
MDASCPTAGADSSANDPPGDSSHYGAVRPTVDLHCHLLPGLDDGACNLADSVAMARQAQEDGIAAICATPHIRHDHDVRIPELLARRAEVAAAIARAGCATQVLGGGEVATTALDGLDDDELRAVSLGGTARWILLEPAPGPLDDQLDSAVKRLSKRGFRPLIAHPERHLAPDLVQRLQRLVSHGALVQATAAFLVSEATREGMVALAQEGVIHVLGSDAHSPRTGRPVTLASGLLALGGVELLAPHLDWIARVAPQAIVSGQDLTPPF